MNVWGRIQVDKGDYCRRKNRNEVDTNRNYQFKRHHYDPLSEEYEGPNPLSEKETQLVSTLLLNGVKRYINIHSGEFSMYMPYDGNTNAPPYAEKMRQFLPTLHPLCKECSKGQAAKVSFTRRMEHRLITPLKREFQKRIHLKYTETLHINAKICLIQETH